jgi:DNA-binding MarR family transcriptional regulator
MTTTTPPASARFGYTLALTERTLSAVLHDHLAKRGIEPGTWYAFQVIVTNRPRIDRAKLTAELAGSRTLDAATVPALLRGLEAQGLISGDCEVELTPQGQALFEDLLQYVAVPRNRLLSQFNADDLETTVRTMQAITDRALEELSPREV